LEEKGGDVTILMDLLTDTIIFCTYVISNHIGNLMATIGHCTDPKKINVFCLDNIPKCAGTALSTILRKSKFSAYHLSNACSLPRLNNLLQNYNKGDTLFCFGHKSWGIHECLSDDFQVIYFTLLRHPISIAISNYNYRVNTYEISHIDINDYLLDFPFTSMVQHLGGTIETAMKRLSYYAIVGIVENFKNTVQHLSELCKTPLDPTIKRNVSKVLSTPDTNLVNELIKYGGPDFNLYTQYNGSLDNFQVNSVRGIEINDPKNRIFTNTDPVFRTYLKKNDIDTIKTDINTNSSVQEFQDKAKAISLIRNITIDEKTILHFVDFLEDNIFDSLSPQQIDSESLYKRLMKIILFLQETPTKDNSSVVITQLINMLIFLAKSDYAAKNNLAEELFLKAMNIGGNNPDRIYDYSIWLRNRGRCQKALTHLQKIKYRDKKFYQEYVTTLYMAEGESALSYFISSNAQLLKRLFKASLFRKHFPQRIKPISHFQTARILIIRSGPLFIFHDLMRSIAKTIGSLSLMIQENVTIEKHWNAEDVFRVPNGPFDPEADFKQKETLIGKKFDYLLFVTTSFNSIDRLANFFIFTEKIPHKQKYFYTMDNMLVSQKEKYVSKLA